MTTIEDEGSNGSVSEFNKQMYRKAMSGEAGDPPVVACLNCGSIDDCDCMEDSDD